MQVLCLEIIFVASAIGISMREGETKEKIKETRREKEKPNTLDRRTFLYQVWCQSLIGTNIFLMFIVGEGQADIICAWEN